MVLTAAPEAVPTYADPFVIVDDRLTVQALSRRAEDVLGVDEPAGVNVPLDHFLVPDRGNADRVELGRAVALALRGESPRTTLEFRRIDDPQVRFRARVASCGPPAAALLILAEPTDEAAAATNGSRRVGFNGNGSGRREGNGAA